MTEIPTVTTERLRLRAPEDRDFEAYAAFCSSDRAKFVGGPYDRAHSAERFKTLTDHWALRGFGRWMVADKHTDDALGIVGLYYPEDWPEPEIAWSLFANGEGRGIACEAALASRDYAYNTLGWTTAISCIDKANTRSVALGRRLGAVYEADFTHPEYGAMNIWRHPSPEALN